MKEDIIKFKKEFTRIKDMGPIKIINKDEDSISSVFKKELMEDNFNNLEIKCLLGFTKANLTLFNYSPKRYKESATKYILDNYGYYNSHNVKVFFLRVSNDDKVVVNDYKFKLKVDYYNTNITLQVFRQDLFVENICVWEFKELEKKLKTKYSTLAIIYGYPYYRNKIKYYKYMYMNIYKLRSFYTFLKLIEEGKIYIKFNLKEVINEKHEKTILNHGVMFKIRKPYLSKLFYNIHIKY